MKLVSIILNKNYRFILIKYKNLQMDRDINHHLSMMERNEYFFFWSIKEK